MPSYKDSNSKWYCKFYYKDWTGERKQKKKSGFDLKRDADAFEREFLEYHSDSPDISFSDFAEKYFEIMKHEWKPTTVDAKRNVIDNHFNAFFGDKKLSEITPIDIKKFRVWEKKNNASDKTMQVYNAHLSAIFNFAVKMYGLSENPCKAAGTIKVAKREMTYITVDEFKTLISDTKQTEQNIMIMKVLFWTGIRISECLALTKSDIHEGYIDVNKNCVYANGKTIIQDTIKNNRNRKVTINFTLCKDMKEYMAKLYGEELFHTSRTTFNDALESSCRRTGIKRIHAHVLRHSHVAMLIHLGYYPKAIADRIGDDVQTVMRTYSHIYDLDEQKMIDDLESLN